MERDFLAFCRTDHRVIRVRAQQLVLHFYDVRRGVRRRYTPDFVVEMGEDAGVGWRSAVVEVKRRTDLMRARTQLRAPLAAARLWAEQLQGGVFKVVTDRAMASGHWLTNARLLSGQIDRPYDSQFEEECAAFLRQRDEFRIGEVLASAQQRALNPQAVLAVLHRMVVRGELYVDRGFAIGPQTWVSVVGAQKRL
ncbi:Tn7 transposase TnsA N-terminal domain-containing protein [Phenylobacterium sp.]|uniref:Tn7 transposase TnsA N-terminal domain-containing protein n=1 Tax=Phenylobacterium sp. TaxID=1871053 RepID=UPI0035AFF655